MTPVPVMQSAALTLVLATVVRGDGGDVRLPYHYANPGMLDHRMFSESRHRKHARNLMQVAAQQLASNNIIRQYSDVGDNASRIIQPVAFGADPTGKTDASAAMTAAVKAFTSLGVGTTDQGAVDLGGAVFDLSGGIYMISQPLLFPPGYSNFLIERGTLVASPLFPKTPNMYLLQVGGLGPCNSTSGGSNNKDCNADVNIQSVTFDGHGLAYGALLVADTMDTNIGPAIMVMGFTAVGISLTGTGAGYIHEAWLGEIPAGSKVKRETANATAILLEGAQHDCDVNNVIIFSGRVGVNSSNGANRIQGVHTWNLVGNEGGIGILLQKGSGRVQQSYLDYAPLVIRSGTRWGGQIAMVEGNFFLGSANIVLQASMPNAMLRGVVITNNVFSTWNAANQTFFLDETDGTFVSVMDTVVEGNSASPAVVKAGKLSTRATQTAVLGHKAPVGADVVATTLDFDAALVFGPAVGIDPTSVQCFISASSATAAVVSPLTTVVAGNTVTVLSSGTTADAGAGDNNVTCTVDQSVRSTPAH
eukprot:m.424050 g.424050  ORF g.424050 m.424050 type:complete len:533 (+) comp21336_c1_seq6:53-1651(+)